MDRAGSSGPRDRRVFRLRSCRRGGNLPAPFYIPRLHGYFHMLGIRRRFEPLAVIAILISGCSSTAPKPKAERPSDSARITQFYATTPATARGDSATLCYG